MEMFIMTYIKCSNCGSFVEEGSSICPECGNRLEDAVPKKRKKRSSVGWIIALVIIVALGIVGKWQYDIYNYGINLHNAIYSVLTSSEQLESAGIQYLSVWSNSIYETQDDETDKFTRNKAGEFYSDFNDALNLLETDADYQRVLGEAEEARNEANTLMGKLINPPSRYEEAYQNMKTLYSAYMAFYNTVVYPSGSLSTYSEKFEQARDKLLEAYYPVSMY